MQHSSNLHVTLPSSEERCVTSNGVNHCVTASRPQPLPNHLSFSSLTCHPSTLLSKPHENKLQALALVSSPQEVQQTIRWWPWNSNRIIQWSGFRENLGELKLRNSKKTMQLVLLKGRLTTSITKEIITANQDKGKFSRKPIRTWCKNKLFAKRARRLEYKSRDLFWFAFDWSNRWREFSRPIKWRGTLKTNAIPGYQRHWSENCSIKLLHRVQPEFKIRTYTYLTIPTRQSRESHSTDVKQANMPIVVRKGNHVIYWWYGESVETI